jgi:hypothetical protein
MTMFRILKKQSIQSKNRLLGEKEGSVGEGSGKREG